MIEEFRGKYRFLSNFFPARTEFEGEFYRTSEHAFVAAKTLNTNERRRIRSIYKPQHAKTYGRQMELRPNWDAIRYDMMLHIVRNKFKDATLAQKLLDTGTEELQEGNTWGDTTWGRVYKNGKWRGKNWLGAILLQVRRELEAAAALGQKQKN